MFNVNRPVDAPASLQNRRKYDEKDVYTALEEIFFNKCYLCETKEPHDINVEHFDPHMGDIEKKFDWNNLYFVCSRCNNIKGDRYNNLVDCCDPHQDVFRAIKHLPPRTPHAKIDVKAINNNVRSIETEEILDKIFNSEHTVNKKVSCSFLRVKIYKQYNFLLDQINVYYSPVSTVADKYQAVERMKVLINRSAPYSAFIRWCIIEDSELGPLLQELMD
ncbi:HNH endonuclease [Aeromonas rivipollensis]|uniref:HNH endonuclease n=1 Tax=Aeromonas rivipollensis TaxID=948519 RepID=UPI0030D243A4